MAKKKTKSQYWEDYFEKYYPGVEVGYNYFARTTIVDIHNSHTCYRKISKCRKGDEWSFEIGFFVTYVKSLREKIKDINGIVAPK